jgi:hypothetical protein
LKVDWRAKNISGGLPISGGFLADMTNFVLFCIWLADSGGFEVSNSKKLIFSLFLQEKLVTKKIILCKIFSKNQIVQNIFKLATSEIRQNPH